MVCAVITHAEELEIPSTFNPVGSGARAVGMGGAFISVADDATAASWNPAGLTQLRQTEVSFVVSGFERKENLSFGTNPEADGEHEINRTDINYFSATLPFECLDYGMVVSVSSQRLYDFEREWDFSLVQSDVGIYKESDWHFEQNGGLSAIGLSYAIRMIPGKLSAGLTLNIWDDSLSENTWEKRYKIHSAGVSDVDPFTSEYERLDEYDFKGFNTVIGMLWDINDTFRIGAVLKAPFSADIDRKTYIKRETRYPLFPDANKSEPPYHEPGNDEIEMPMSYGIGFVCRVSDDLYVSADIYRTEWGDFISIDETGNKTSAVSGRPTEESNVKPTHQIRFGAEYLLMKEDEKRYAVPVRCGIFYDPAPAENSPDDYYGFSAGIGFTKIDRISLDIAYQFRYGNDVGRSILESFDFSQDVHEHTVYMSMIFYPFSKDKTREGMKWKKSE